MAKPTRLVSHGTFFVTTQTHNRHRLFETPTTAQLLLDTLQHYRHEGNYNRGPHRPWAMGWNLHAFVIMPDHIHLLLTPHEITLERTMQLIKGGFSHRLESKFPAWQRSFQFH